ncbi:MBL fold metallo-hydrolase [Candidatus Woesearchaeota archaeon]|nr:MBL fold metallo-hydrolase [Candidatus Woesearchaeota archaeon]
MKLTKYPQSCFLIEAKDKRILIDPGILDYASEWLTNDWTNIHLILITHKHQDHCNISALKYLVEKGAMIFSSKEVQDAYPELRIHIIKEGDVLKIPGGVKIEATPAVHGYIPALKGKELKENIGFIIDDGDIRVYFTSDTIGFSNDYKCDVLCLPVSNHGLTFGAIDAAWFAKETEADLVIPTHYDNPKYLVDLNEVKRVFEQQNINFKILNNKETTEL